jgi:hypothetical protein
MKLDLPNVTIVAIDGKAHALTRLALDDTLRLIEPGDVIIITNDLSALARHNTQPCICRLDSYDDVALAHWRLLPDLLRTSHYLVIQWDGWVLNPSLWDPKWLELDYVGAPWGGFEEGESVGNGGFSLRSRDLLRYLAQHPSEYPPTHPEDATLCRKYRPQLEQAGFRWATTNSASKFAFEREPPRPTFGFHGIFNWPSVLCPNELHARLKYCNDFVKSKPEWPELAEGMKVRA